MANPIEALLVRFGHHWPGLRRSWPAPPMTVRCPPGFFRGSDEGGTFPETAVLEFHRLSGFDDLTDDELAAHVKKAVFEREEMFRQKADAEGKRFLGRRAILRQSRYGRPSSRAPHFGISPRVACQDKWRRIERLARNREWLMDYHDSRRRWSLGERGISFPYGTYQLRVDAGVRCRPPPES